MLHLSLIRRKPSAIDRAPHALALNLVRMLGLSAATRARSPRAGSRAPN